MVKMNIKALIAIVGIVSIFLVGCSSSLEHEEEQYIYVQKRISEEYNYEPYKEIYDAAQVQKVRAIVDQISWEIREVEVVRAPDYTFAFQYSDIKANAPLYQLWIINKDMVELVIKGESKYAKLDDGSMLLELLIGRK